MKKAIPYIIPFTVPLICILGIEAGGVYQLSLYFYLAALVPVLDALLGRFGILRFAGVPKGLQ